MMFFTTHQMLRSLRVVLVFVLAMALNSQLSYAQKVDLEKGLIGYYTFENEASDKSGSGNDGTLEGVNSDIDITGTDQGCYRWNDEDDFISLPIDMNIGALPQVSLCAWVYVKNLSIPVTVISNDDRGGDRKLYSTKSDKKMVWAISDGKGGFIGNQPVHRKHWTFLVATYDEDTKKAAIYVDGVQASGKTQMEMGSNLTYIGGNPYENANKDFEALIDEVRIYNRVLSKSEIMALRDLQDIPQYADVVKEEKSYIYLVKQDNLIVNAGKSADTKKLGVVNTSDTLTGKEVKAKNVAWAEWLEIDFEGAKGYVNLKYLDKTTLDAEPETEFTKAIKKYTDFSGWQFWVITVGLLLFSYGASVRFGWVDGVLGTMTQNFEYEGNAAFFSIFSGFSGVLFALLMVIWQDNIEYYLAENFTIWPVGYGFAAWAVWVLIVVNLLTFSLLVFESLRCGNLIHGILRIIIQAVLGVLTFVSSAIITIALILIVIGLLVVFIAVSALFYRRVYTDMWGNRYVED